MEIPELKKIVISRTDNIGDVVLTLPIAGYLKKKLPNVIIYFIGKSYTKPIVDSCIHIDYFIDRDTIIQDDSVLKRLEADLIIFIFPDMEIAKAARHAKIPTRIGTSHRWFHWLYCNKLMNFSRKNSKAHESLLNFKLLQSLFPGLIITLPEIPELYGMKAKELLPQQWQNMLNTNKIKVILHPKSKGSAREWPLENYRSLAQQFSEKKFDFFVTGNEKEGNEIKNTLPDLFSSGHIHDLTGQLSLGELIAFIENCDGLVACSTGPLHIAAALGIAAIGIYPPMKPIDPGRWGAAGKKSKVLVVDRNCSDCRTNGLCHCIAEITVSSVAVELKKIYGS